MSYIAPLASNADCGFSGGVLASLCTKSGLKMSLRVAQRVALRCIRQPRANPSKKQLYETTDKGRIRRRTRPPRSASGPPYRLG